MLCSILPPNFPQTFLVNLTLAPSIGCHLKPDQQRECAPLGARGVHDESASNPLTRAELGHKDREMLKREVGSRRPVVFTTKKCMTIPTISVPKPNNP